MSLIEEDYRNMIFQFRSVLEGCNDAVTEFTQAQWEH